MAITIQICHNKNTNTGQFQRKYNTTVRQKRGWTRHRERRGAFQRRAAFARASGERTGIQISYKYKTNIIQIRNRYHTNTKQISYKYETNIIQIRNKYHTNTKQISYKYETNPTQIKYKFNTNTFKRQLNYVTNTKEKNKYEMNTKTDNT